MSEAALVINHSNFKQNRSAYGFTLRDIADRAGVSVSTVDNYEKFDSSYIRTRNRDDNAKRIERALSELIDEQIVRVFPNSISQKEDKVVEEKKKRGGYHPPRNVFDRRYVSDKLHKYCEDNGLGFTEFCIMCDVAPSNFCECMIKKQPNMYPSTIAKIIKATSWDIDAFKEDKNVPFSALKHKMTVVENATNKLEEKFSKRSEVETTEKKNKQFIFRDGKYFMEYDIIVTEHKVEEISKEEFLQSIK